MTESLLWNINVFHFYFYIDHRNGTIIFINHFMEKRFYYRKIHDYPWTILLSFWLNQSYWVIRLENRISFSLLWTLFGNLQLPMFCRFHIGALHLFFLIWIKVVGKMDYDVEFYIISIFFFKNTAYLLKVHINDLII